MSAPVTTPAATGLSRPVAATIGVLAVWAALGVGHLVAGLFSAGSSPYLAVGDAVIRLSPEPLTEFAKVYLGTNDKPVLLVGIFVVITLVAAAAGLASRRRPQPGAVVIGAMGVLGGAAVVFGPTFTQADLVAPLASMVAGLGTFAFLHALGSRALSAEPAEKGLSRRSVLMAGGAAVGLAALASAAGGVLLTRNFQAARDDVTALLGRAKFVERATSPAAGAAFPQLGTPTFLTPNSEFYRIDTALRVPTLTAVRLAPARARHGRARAHAELRRPGQAARSSSAPSRLTCVSNPIGGNLISTANFVGVAAARRAAGGGHRPRRRPAVQHEHRRLVHRHADGDGAGARPRRAAGDRDERRGAALRARFPGAHGRARPLRLRVGHEVAGRPRGDDVRQPRQAGLLAAARLVAARADQDR